MSDQDRRIDPPDEGDKIDAPGRGGTVAVPSPGRNQPGGTLPMARILRPGLPVSYALSLKQPWATLLVHGRKTVEVRSWRPTRRGRILIHAARIPDERPEAWQQVPPDLLEAARQPGGGIVGAADLVDYLVYRDAETDRVSVLLRRRDGHFDLVEG